MKPVIIGNATLYLGDCREILPTLPKVDAVITENKFIGADYLEIARANKGVGSTPAAPPNRRLTMTSDFRKEFEGKFPVPSHVYWNDGFDCDGAYESDCEWAVSVAVAYDHKWRGYCAGYIAALYKKMGSAEVKDCAARSLAEELKDAGTELSRRMYGNTCCGPDCGIATNLAFRAANELIRLQTEIDNPPRRKGPYPEDWED